MDSPQDICKKYCKQRLQKLVDDKPCPFHLTSVETEMEGEDLKVHTVCEGTIEYPFNTIIDRISKVTKKGIEIIKEVIKHEKMRQYANPLEDMKIGDSPIYPQQPITMPNVPQYPQYPWTVTCSVDSTTFSNDLEEPK